MKNVLISAYACIPERGSEEGNGWYYSSIVSQSNHRVWCLTRSMNKKALDEKLAQVPHPNLTYVYVETPDWVEKVYYWGLIGMYFHYLYWQWAALKTARPLNRQHNFDIVHHVSYGSLQLGSLLYKLNRPFIFGPIGGGQEAPDSMRHYFKGHWKKEKMRTLVSQLLLRFNPGCFEAIQKADHVLVWNEDTRRKIEWLGRTRGVTKEFSGISEAFIPPTPLIHTPGPVLQLVWVGRLMPRKALELTLHGLSKVDRRLPVQLTVVGDGEMGQYMPEYLSRYNLTDRVNWTGYVGYEQVKAFYQQADVFFFTSLRDTGPAQLLEAMAYSLPVVTLNIHGQAELVNESTGIRVPVTDQETVSSELAKAIEWMYHHPDERLAMGANAYEFASQQTWELKIRRFIRAYYGPTDELPDEKVKRRPDTSKSEL
ncbi:glycosyltransferase family 4 protein [uncultured Fibrella sp.]|uniref:glycosyltransferase family 4 protein n=1 Tax=uncultured Fibrella sp. TaxID=1284596 RepID=UPI0035CA72A1